MMTQARNKKTVGGTLAMRGQWHKLVHYVENESWPISNKRVRKRHQAIRPRKKGMAVRRHRCRCAGQRHLYSPGMNLQGEWRRSVPLSRLAVREGTTRRDR